MSLFSRIADAFKKGKQPKKAGIDMKTHGPLGSTTQSDSGAFDPLRPGPQADTGQGIDRGGVSGVGEPQVKSADPEEGGEVSRP